MRRGYAGPITCTVTGIDLTDYSIYLTIKSRGREITKTGADLSVAYDEGVTAIVFNITQQESLSLTDGTAKVQVRYVSADGSADATVEGTLNVLPILKEGVLPYTGGYSDD